MNEFKQWITGLISVLISSAASGVIISVVDPSTFNIHGGFSKLGTVCGLEALLHGALYLQKSPIWNTNPTQPTGSAKK